MSYKPQVLTVLKGGTSSTSFTANTVLYGNGTSAISETTGMSNGNLIIGSTGNAPVVTSLTAGSNITITPGAGSISIAATGGTSGAGDVIQQIVQLFSTQSSTTSTIPQDDTKPQNTEGTELFTQAITPTDADSKLIVEVFLFAYDGTLALFKDDTADALAAVRCATNFYSALLYTMVAGTTSSITFKVRYGPPSGTGYYNKWVGTGLFDGRLNSWIRVSEVVVI